MLKLKGVRIASGRALEVNAKGTKQHYNVEVAIQLEQSTLHS